MDITKEFLETLVCERYRTDERYRSGHLKIVAPAPGTKILGIHTPELKMVAKAIVKDGSWRNIIDGYASHKPLTGEKGLIYEERMIWGLVLDYAKCPIEERLQLIDAFIPAIDSWELCDNFCCNSKWAEKEDKATLRNYLLKLFHCSDQWSIRVATILSMCHFLGPDDINQTFKTIDTLDLRDSEPYYVRMGIAWLLATALAKNQNTTLAFIRSCHLPQDIIKLFIRKARESRITHNVLIGRS